jgi:Tol biopolymer transport system component
VQGPRHWVRSSPDGTKIAFLMRDASGFTQLWTVSPNGGEREQVTHDPWSVASSFTWSPAGLKIAYVADNSIFVVETASGHSRRLTLRCVDEDAPLPLACVFAPDGKKIAYMRRLAETSTENTPRYNQIFTVESSANV